MGYFCLGGSHFPATFIVKRNWLCVLPALFALGLREGPNTAVLGVTVAADEAHAGRCHQWSLRH